jgi:hypothetical protein
VYAGHRAGKVRTVPGCRAVWVLVVLCVCGQSQ